MLNPLRYISFCFYCSYEKLTELTSKKSVIVLPAFETAPNKDEPLAHALAGAAAGMNKNQLKRLVDRNLVYQFAKYLYQRVRESPCTLQHKQ